MFVITFAVSGVILGPFVHGQTPNLTAVLLGTFFLSFSVPFWWTTFCYIFGRTELLIAHDELRAFTGIGSIGRTLRLPLRDILDIETPVRIRSRNSMYVSGGFRVWLPDVPPNDRRAVYFGRLLTEARRDWMATELFRRFEGSGDEPG